LGVNGVARGMNREGTRQNAALPRGQRGKKSLIEISEREISGVAASKL